MCVCVCSHPCTQEVTSGHHSWPVWGRSSLPLGACPMAVLMFIWPQDLFASQRCPWRVQTLGPRESFAERQEFSGKGRPQFPEQRGFREPRRLAEPQQPRPGVGPAAL